MNHNKFTMENKNENGMVTVISYNNLKTEVRFGFDPKRVDYKGKIDLETLKEL